MDNEKPFYLRPPWEILFEEAKLEKVSPWSINLVHLLTSLLEEMNRVGIDFRAAGTAINSSVIIYLKKAELLLKMEEPPKTPQEKMDIYVPPPLAIPFRFEMSTTTIGDLVKALERALNEASASGSKPRLPTLPLPIPELINLEAYLLEIEKRSRILLEKIKAMSVGGEPLTFSKIVTEQSWLEIIRVFMMLLFLAQQGEIELEQDEDEAEIIIMVSKV